jgi:large subunit ribosomal protein L29
MKNLSNEDLLKSIEDSKKELFDLRLKRATRQTFKPHLFKHTKRKIAQLLTLQSERLQTKKDS